MEVLNIPTTEYVISINFNIINILNGWPHLEAFDHILIAAWDNAQNKP